MSQKFFALTFLTTLFFSLTTSAKPIAFIAFGDAPYFVPEAHSMFDKLRQQVDKDQPNFAIHVGDIRGGNTTCSNKTLLRVKKHFDSFQTPLFYTPGDNEWTDCHRYKQDPIERLDFLRKTFFDQKMSFGENKLSLLRQPDVRSRYKTFVENSFWQIKKVSFATLHIVGSNNNYAPKKPTAMSEHRLRSLANQDWLDYIFESSINNDSQALVLFIHANPLFEKDRANNLGFKNFLNSLSHWVTKFQKSVLLVHGDSHSFQFNMPLKAVNAWDFEYPLPNFYRLEVFGAPEVRGVKVIINTNKNDQPFSIEALPSIPWEYPL